MTIIIGICGQTAAGKTFARKHVAAGYDALPISMADALKRMLLELGLEHSDVYGSQEHRMKPNYLLCGKTSRHAMQTLGTEWGRKLIGNDVWVNATEASIATICAGEHAPDYIVIDDIRFPNEVAMIKRLGGVLWRVRREEVEAKRSALDVWLHRIGLHPFIHESEYHWRDFQPDVELRNNTQLADFDALLSLVMHNMEVSRVRKSA